MESCIIRTMILLGVIIVNIGLVGSDDTCDVGSGNERENVGDFSFDIADKWINLVVTAEQGSPIGGLPTPPEVRRAEANDGKAYAVSLLDDHGSRAIASQAVSLASEAQSHLEKLEYWFNKKITNENEMSAPIAKLGDVYRRVAEVESRLRSSVEAGTIKQNQLAASFISVQSSNRKMLSQSLDTWIDNHLVHPNDTARQTSIMPKLHGDLHNLEWGLVDSLKKIRLALVPETTASSVRARADKLLQEVLPLLKGSFFTSSSIGTFRKYNATWEEASALAGNQGAQIISHEIAPLFHIHPDITSHFVDNAVKESFPGLVKANKKALSSYAGGSGKDAFICLRISSNFLGDDTACGCYKAPSRNKITLLEHRDLPEEFGDNRHVLTGCKHMLFTALRAPVDIGSSSFTPDSTCASREARIQQMGKNTASYTPLRICMVTWNVGSERDIATSGVGWGGVEGLEFKRDLDRLLNEACTHKENDVVVLAFQEASDGNSRDVIEKSVKANFGEWHVSHVYANAAEGASTQGYNGLNYLHELGQLTKYHPGVNLVLLVRSKPLVVRRFGMVFKGGAIKQWGQWFAEKFTKEPWLGDKGTAIAQLKLLHDGRERTICFAASHLDAGKEEKRVEQTTKTQKALETIGCPDGAWWGGDFNPRLFDNGPSQACCQWDRLEFLMHHGAKDAVVDLTRSIDPIGRGYSWRKDTTNAAEVAPFAMTNWQCQGKQCSAGWHEFPIGFAPTFHKLYHRRDRNYKEGTCHFAPRNVAKVGVHGAQGVLSGDELQHLNNASMVTRLGKDGKCPGSGHRVELCWNGEYSFDGCSKNGYCHHVHHKDHCPLYTDRILHAFKMRNNGDFTKLSPDSDFPIVVGCRYEAIPSITTADHAPVLAQFTVTFGDM